MLIKFQEGPVFTGPFLLSRSLAWLKNILMVVHMFELVSKAMPVLSVHVLGEGERVPMLLDEQGVILPPLLGHPDKRFTIAT